VTIKEETAERAKRIAAALIEATAARRRSEVDVRIPRAREKTETPGQVMDLAGLQEETSSQRAPATGDGGASRLPQHNAAAKI
jgi:hypothetical protein